MQMRNNAVTERFGVIAQSHFVKHVAVPHEIIPKRTPAGGNTIRHQVHIKFITEIVYLAHYLAGAIRDHGPGMILESLDPVIMIAHEKNVRLELLNEIEAAFQVEIDIGAFILGTFCAGPESCQIEKISKMNR